MTVSWNEGKLKSYSNFFRRLIKIFLPGELLPNESKMEMMGAVIRKTVLPWKAPKSPASGAEGFFFGPLLREVALGNRYEAASDFRSNVFQPKYSILKTLKRSNIAFLLEINRTRPYLKVKASHNVQRDAELGHINPFAVPGARCGNPLRRRRGDPLGSHPGGTAASRAAPEETLIKRYGGR